MYLIDTEVFEIARGSYRPRAFMQYANGKAYRRSISIDSDAAQKPRVWIENAPPSRAGFCFWQRLAVECEILRPEKAPRIFVLRPNWSCGDSHLQD